MSIESSFFPWKEKKKYDYFSEANERRDIFLFSEGLSQYAHKNKIKNVIFVDSSARPAWVGFDEYWRSTYPNEKEPGIFFMNPTGFDTESESFMDKAFGSLNSFFGGEERRGNSTIVKELNEKYPTLVKDKEDPLLIFDTCAHTGGTIRDIKDVLEEAGFEDIRIITANLPEKKSKITSELSFEEQSLLKHCYPFGRDGSVDRPDDSITSERSEGLYERRIGMRIRNEIRQIIRENLNKS